MWLHETLQYYTKQNLHFGEAEARNREGLREFKID